MPSPCPYTSPRPIISKRQLNRAEKDYYTQGSWHRLATASREVLSQVVAHLRTAKGPDLNKGGHLQGHERHFCLHSTGVMGYFDTQLRRTSFNFPEEAPGLRGLSSLCGPHNLV